jgi:hypothetical protein
MTILSSAIVVGSCCSFGITGRERAMVDDLLDNGRFSNALMTRVGAGAA